MSAKVNRAITLEEGRSPERANRRHSGSCASRSRSRSDWRRASSANPILPSEPRRKMRCNADQLAHRLRSFRRRDRAGRNPTRGHNRERRSSDCLRLLSGHGANQRCSWRAKIAGFSRRNGNFVDFPHATVVWLQKWFRKSSPCLRIPVVKRTGDSRPPNRGIAAKTVRTSASSTTAEHQRRTRKKHNSPPVEMR
jgi:hypothetical protein